jgi:hypothetical protein
VRTFTIFSPGSAAGACPRARWWRNLRGQAEVVEGKAAVDDYLDRYPRVRLATGAPDPPMFVRVIGLTPKS